MNCSRTDLVALCDIDESKLTRYGAKLGVSSLYRDVESMLSKEKPDIVSVCTPTSSHYEVVKIAVQHGVRAIYCEKPIADTLTKADEMVRLCDANGVVLMINHQRRFDPVHQAARQFLKNNEAGRIQHAMFHYTAGIANTGSHIVDLIRFLISEVEWVQGYHSVNSSQKPDDPNIDGIMKLSTSSFCSLNAYDVNDFLIFELDIIGTKCRLRLTHSGYGLDYYSVGDSHLFSGYKELYKADTPINTDVSREPLLEAVNHTVDCIEGKAEPISSGMDGRKALELIEALKMSAMQDGKRVYLPLGAS